MPASAAVLDAEGFAPLRELRHHVGVDAWADLGNEQGLRVDRPDRVDWVAVGGGRSSVEIVEAADSESGVETISGLLPPRHIHSERLHTHPREPGPVGIVESPDSLEV